MSFAQRLRTFFFDRGGLGVLVEDLAVDDEGLGLGLRLRRCCGGGFCGGRGFRRLFLGGFCRAFGAERRRHFHSGAFGGGDLVRPDGDASGGDLGVGLGSGSRLASLGARERGDLFARGRLGGGRLLGRHDPLRCRCRLARVDGAAQPKRAVVGDVARVVLLDAREPRVRLDELGVGGTLT